MPLPFFFSCNIGIGVSQFRRPSRHFSDSFSIANRPRVCERSWQNRFHIIMFHRRLTQQSNAVKKNYKKRKYYIIFFFSGCRNSISFNNIEKGHTHTFDPLTKRLLGIIQSPQWTIILFLLHIWYWIRPTAKKEKYRSRTFNITQLYIIYMLVYYI